MGNNSLLQLISMQFKEFIRDPEVLAWGLIFPVALAWILGIAFSSQDKLSRPIGIVQTQTADPHLLQPWLERVQSATQSQAEPGMQTRFKFITLPDAGAALTGLKRGRFSLYVDQDPAAHTLRYHFDPANTDARLLYLLLRQAEQGGPAAAMGTVVPLQGIGNRYIDFLVPGLIALGIMNSCMWGAGWALIERRMKKLLRRMVATPMRRYEMLLSYFFTRTVLTTFEVGVLYLFASIYFHVQVQGSWPALIAMFLAGNMAFIGIAVLMGSRTASTQVGNGLLNVITVPMTLLSGIFFSYYNFPEWAVGLIRVLPLTLLADGLRKVFIEGAGLLSVAVPALTLAATGAVAFIIGLRIFRWF
jgi:ABC-2 type transport system permease protein